MNKKNLLENINVRIKANDKHAEFYDYYETLRKGFQKIVVRAVAEPLLHKYIEENPLLLLNAGLKFSFPFAKGRCALFSKLKLAERYETDFAFVHADSTGANWMFIELKRSDVKLFNKKGKMSKFLNDAYGQVLGWQAWIKDNKAYAQEILGRLQNSAGIKKDANFSTDPNFMIIIGRRKMLDQETQRRRNELCNSHPRLKIITYDRLLEPIALFNDTSNKKYLKIFAT